jgi:hypothetical protein
MITASKCTSRPDCQCQFCTVDRYLPSEEDTLALEFIAQLAKTPDGP